PNDVGVLRMNANAANLPRLDKADALPCLSAVHRLVHTVAMRGIATDTTLAHARVDDVRVGLGDRDRPYSARLDLSIGHRIPVGATIGGLEDPAPDAAEIVCVQLRWRARDGNHTSAAIWPDGAIFQRSENLRIIGSNSERS